MSSPAAPKKGGGAKGNLDMRIAMLQARAGQKPSLGVARYLRQKATKSSRGARALSRRAGVADDGEAPSRLQSLHGEKAARQRSAQLDDRSSGVEVVGRAAVDARVR